MTPNAMRKKADEIEAAGGPMALERANKLRDDANDLERKGYEEDKAAGKLNNKGGMISEYGGAEKYKSKAAKKKHESKESKSEEKMEKGMHRMPDGKMMKNSAHKKPKKMMGGGSVKGYGMARGGRACKMV